MNIGDKEAYETNEDDDIQFIGENSPDIVILKEKNRRTRRYLAIVERLPETEASNSFDARSLESNSAHSDTVQPSVHCCLHSSKCRLRSPGAHGHNTSRENTVHRLTSLAETEDSFQQPYAKLHTATRTAEQHVLSPPEGCNVYQPCVSAICNACSKPIQGRFSSPSPEREAYQPCHSFGNNNVNEAQEVTQSAATESNVHETRDATYFCRARRQSPLQTAYYPHFACCSSHLSAVLPSFDPHELSRYRCSRNNSNIPEKSRRKRKTARKQTQRTYEGPNIVMSLLQNSLQDDSSVMGSLNPMSKRMQALQICLKQGGAKAGRLSEAGYFVENERNLYSNVATRSRISKLKAYLRRYGVRKSYMECFIKYIRNELQ